MSSSKVPGVRMASLPAAEQKHGGERNTDQLLDAHLQLALALRQAKEYGAATQVVRWAIKRFPSAAPAHFSLGLLYLDRQRYTDAQRAFRAAISVAEADTETRLAAFVGLARACRANGRHREAVQWLRLAIDSGLPTPDLLMMLADSLVQAGRAGDAIDVLGSVEPDAPEFIKATELRAEVLVDLKRYDEAVVAYSRAIDKVTVGSAVQTPLHHRLLIGRADALREAGETDRALEEITVVVHGSPDDVDALLLQALLLRDKGRLREALDVLDSVPPGWSTTNVEYLLMRAELLLGLDRTDEVMDVVERVVEMAPETPHSYVIRSSIAFQEVRYEDALDDLNRALDLGLSPSVEVYQHKGEAYAMLDRHADAVDAFTSALEIDPRNALALAYRGEMLRLLRRHRDALADLDQSVSLDRSALALSIRGDILRDLGNFEAAIDNFDEADQLQPGDPWTIGRRGEVYRLVGRLDMAIVDFDRALALESDDDAWVLGSRGEAYLAMRHFEEARRDLELACRTPPHFFWAFAARGELNLLTENPRAAFEDLERACNESETDWYLYLRGLAKVKLGQADSAVADFQRAREVARERSAEALNPDQLDLSAALYLIVLGEYRDAVAEYQRVLQRSPAAPTIREALRDVETLELLGIRLAEECATIPRLLKTALAEAIPGRLDGPLNGIFQGTVALGEDRSVAMGA